MPFVIAEPCIGVKDKSCVEVCPVNCIYEGEDQYYIHPDECIDCQACEAASGAGDLPGQRRAREVERLHREESRALREPVRPDRPVLGCEAARVRASFVSRRRRDD
jgi:Fe-S-cluster-containing hydrogenase component 2